LEIVELLRDRCPDLEWHSGRVTRLLGDFPECDHFVVASGCADWIKFGSSGRVRDGVSVLRTRLERAKTASEQSQLLSNNPGLTDYDSFS